MIQSKKMYEKRADVLITDKEDQILEDLVKNEKLNIKNKSEAVRACINCNILSNHVGHAPVFYYHSYYEKELKKNGGLK